MKKKERMRKRSLVAAAAALAVVLSMAIPAVAGPVSNAAGFEGDDGNLAPQAPINFDWNSFAPTEWIGAAQLRTATDSAGGWEFTGLEDRQATGADSAFAGGTKQDHDCATVVSQKAPNKDDLKRYYLATKTDAVTGDIFLSLAWVRIPQNTTSASAHVGFEFNQGDTPCGAGSDGLVERTAGDLLFVYDFEGGSTNPSITLREWVTSGACEVGSNSPPCWGTASDLTASGFAEAEVNVGTSVLDEVADPDETLNDSEFGETVINLSDAGVFTPGECIAFGKTYAVSRSSGNSAQAQMKDLVGPADINIQNCGSIIIHKQTVPSPDPTGTTFNYTTTGGLVPASPSLVDGGTEDFQSPEIQAGAYSVTESDPGPNFALTAINCTASGTSSFTTDLVTRTVNIDLDATNTVECTFVNTLQTGALRILKNTTKGGPVSDAGAVFEYVGPSGTASATDNGAGDQDADVGEVCVSGLLQGDYDVTETSAPPGYGLPADPGPETVTVVAGTNCTDNPPTGSAVVTFTDPPLADIQVNFRDGGSGETSATSITCENTGTTPDTMPATGWDDSVTHEDIRIDPSPRTITCTIVIDP
jgi:Prealbumin-like fold domain